jgi:hypothetical protein
MAAFFPFLKDNSAELRKWTVRVRLGRYRSAPIVERRVEITLEGLSRVRAAPLPFADELDLGPPLAPAWNDFAGDGRWMLQNPVEQRQGGFRGYQDELSVAEPEEFVCHSFFLSAAGAEELKSRRDCIRK